jgi:myo-inositol-1(or 4)-monophosphatase
MNDVQKRAHLDVAVDAARKAGALVKSMMEQGDVRVSEKHMNDFVTNADRASETLIISTIKERFPDESFFGEESGEQERSGNGRWVIDPIDGTTNYFRGIPDWTISIAWEIEPCHPLVGVVYVVLQDELFSAVEGDGARLNGKPVHVSSTDDHSRAVIVCVPPHRHHDAAPAYFAAEQRIFDGCSDLRSFGSCALELAYIACGRLDGYYERFLGYYDLAGGLALLREAGGKLEFLGTHDDTHCDFIASNGKIHDWLREQVQ